MTDHAASTGSLPVVPATARGALPWVIWVVGTLTYLVAILGRSSLAGIGTDTVVRFSADSSTLALFATLQLAVYGGMQIPAGLLLDRFGARLVLTAGMTVMAAGSVWLAFAPDAASAIGARALTGAGDAMVFPSVLRLLTLWFPAGRVPLLQQITAQAGQLGQILSVAVLAVGVRVVSWEAAFCALAVVFVVFAVVNGAVVRERGVTLHRRGASAGPGQFALLGAAMREPGTRLAFWVHFVTPFAGTTVALLWGVPFLIHGEGLASDDASLMITVYVLAGAVFAPLMGTLSGSYPRHRPAIAVVSVLAQAATLGGILLWPGPAPIWLLIVWMVALSSGSAASMIAFDVARRHNPVQRLSTATGVVNMGGFIAALIAMYVIGLVLDLQHADPSSYTLDELRWAFGAIGVLWLVGLGGIAAESRRLRVRR
ncbi:MAG: MFS transporter [Microbacterium sp.]|uniref:MFS transporter n=1 Tax=Microbacterium sp. TaxID=51671 RepID=UPI0039E2B0F0